MSESFCRRATRFVLKRIPVYAGIYVAVVAVFLWFELRLVFHPHTAAEAWLPPPDRRTQDVEFTSADGTKLHAWWLPPTRPEAGAFLVSHGNGGNLSYRGDLAIYLNKATDAGVLMYDYPGYGKSDGSPTEAGCYASCDAAYAWLTTDGKISPLRVVLLGESIGTGVAVEAATRHDHRALVLMCPFTTLPAAAKHHYPWLPTHTLMRSRFDSLSRIHSCTRPLLVGHSTDDRVVPFWQGETLYNAANEPKELQGVAAAGHNLATEQFAGVVARFLEKHPASK
ncbi:MAG: alpha/beta hydrolase [Gemmataceae bacterium]